VVCDEMENMTRGSFAHSEFLQNKKFEIDSLLSPPTFHQIMGRIGFVVFRAFV